MAGSLHTDDITIGVSASPHRAFMEGLVQGEIRLQRCCSCRKMIYHPRLVCPHCHSTDLEWRVVSGKGEIYSYTEVAQKEEPYNIVLVDLIEGVRLMSTYLGDPQTLRIGLKVRARSDTTPGSSPRVVCDSVEGL
jgi:uncharacterized protein